MVLESGRSKIVGPCLVKVFFLLGSFYCVPKHQMISHSERDRAKGVFITGLLYR